MDDWDASSDDGDDWGANVVGQIAAIKKEKAWDDSSDDEEETEVVQKFAPVQAPQQKKTVTAEGEGKPEQKKKIKGAGGKKASKQRREDRLADAMKNRSKDELRSPICCVLGHVDTGKTKVLDKIRRTNVQGGEAGGITQQIGATYFPMKNLRKATDKLNKDLRMEYKVPGLLVIDTPGHESFTNLRTRGSSLCDIAILVIDIMHGLEAQTVESLELLRSRKTPFIVALNKVDRLYGWKVCPDTPIREALAQQEDFVIQEYETRVQSAVTQLMEKGLNAALYYDNEDYKRVVSLVPTSAHSGEGIPDLLLLLVQLSQQMMTEKLMVHTEVQCTVIEVKMIEGHGTTIDVVLVNGELKDSDTIVVAGTQGPIVTPIRALLTPQPLKEMRVKGEYVHHKSIKASMGIKIAATNLENAIAGTSLMVLRDGDDQEDIEETVMQDVADVMGNVSTTGRGVCVQASTLGSLEALMEFLRVSKIPVAGVSIGPVNKKDVMRASVMLEHQKEYATILAFDVKVSREAQELAEGMEVKIFTAEIIYHLFDQFTAYMKDVAEKRRAEIGAEAVFPCVLRIIPENVFMQKNPIVVGVDIVEGIAKIGTPIVVPDQTVEDFDHPGQRKMLELGKIVSMERDNKPVETAKRGEAVCIKIQGSAAQSYIQYGRHFDADNNLVSKLSRNSIDLLKENFKSALQKEDWMLVIKLKKVFNII